MRPRNFATCILITTSTLWITTHSVSVRAQNYNDLIIFSDSLSDIGNLYDALSADQQFPIPPSPPYFQKRFSNGLVWTENLSLSLGITPNPNNNYSFGGSQTGQENLFEFNSSNPLISVSITVPGLLGQVNNYANYATGGNIPNNNDLFLLWIGANDYLQADLTSSGEIANTLNTVITNTNIAVATLNGFGAKNIAVANLPNFANIPRVISLDNSDISNALTDLTIAHNQALDSSLSDLELALGDDSLNLEIIDMFRLFENISSNPSSFGFTNVTEGCLLSPSCDPSNVANADQFFFWDDLHPTARGHEIIAEFALQSIPDNSATTPETSRNGSFLLLGLIGLFSKLLLKSSSKN